MIKKMVVLMGPLLISVLVSCGGGGDGTPTPISDQIAEITTCTNTLDDSLAGFDFKPGRIRSHMNGSNVYQNISAVRQVIVEGSSTDVFIDYMVHSAEGTEKALLVLVSGGRGDAKIEGPGFDGEATRSSGNFLVRSAHLFAAQGYKVVTIDRPSDYLLAVTSSSSLYDEYRTSAKHAVDLVSIINKENTNNLPVIIAGTSRGAISAVAQFQLADAISISSSATSKFEGDTISTPVSESGPVKPSLVSVATHVMWHVDDACAVTTPADSESLVTAFSPNAANNPISGGFYADDGRDCSGDSYHGFYGIESCAVGASTAWMDAVSLPSTRPIQRNTKPFGNYASPGQTIDIPVGGDFEAAKSGAELTFSLPHASTSLGGSITIVENSVQYTAPAAVNDTIDYFVYIVTEADGGKRAKVVSVNVTLTP